MSDLIWWAVGGFGLSGVLLVGAILIFGWPVIVQFFLGTKIGRILLMVAAALAAVFGVYLKGRSEGRAAERAKHEKQTKKEVAAGAKRRKSIDALPDDEVKKRLRRWTKK